MSESTWTQQDVAAFLKVAIRTVQKLDVPRIPLEIAPGKRPIVRYDPAEVRAWWEAQCERARRARATQPAVRVAASRTPRGAIHFDKAS